MLQDITKVHETHKDYVTGYSKGAWNTKRSEIPGHGKSSYPIKSVLWTIQSKAIYLTCRCLNYWVMNLLVYQIFLWQLCWTSYKPIEFLSRLVNWLSFRTKTCVILYSHYISTCLDERPIFSKSLNCNRWSTKLSINNINISEFQAQSLQTSLTDFKGLVSLSSSMYSAIFTPIP